MSDIVIPSDKFARLYEKTVCGYAELIEGAFSLKECERLYDCADQFDDTCREILEINGDWMNDTDFLWNEYRGYIEAIDHYIDARSAAEWLNEYYPKAINEEAA